MTSKKAETAFEAIRKALDREVAGLSTDEYADVLDALGSEVEGREDCLVAEMADPAP